MGWWKPKKQQFIYRREVHAHLLPGLDDGVKSIKEAVKMIDRMDRLGIEHFSLTPHVCPPSMPNNEDTIGTALANLQRALPEYADRLKSGAEYRMSETLLNIIAHEKLVGFEKKYILIEHSFIAESPYFAEICFNLLHQGYTPVLAHPERYPFFQCHVTEKCEEVKKKGGLLQTNLLSFAGFYGKEAEKAAFRLLKSGMIDFVGSDAHSMLYVEALEDFLFSKTAGKLNNYPFRNK